MSGKYRIRAKISDTESMFVEFKEEPTEQEIIDKVNFRCAVLKGNGMKVNVNSQVEAIDFPVTVTLSGKEVANPNIAQLIEAGWRYQVPFEIPNYTYAVNKIWAQDADNMNMATCTCDFILDTEYEEDWQTDKTSRLKLTENAFINFLTDDWTPVLRLHELVDAKFTATPSNVDEATTAGLLLKLRDLDKEEYAFCAGELDRFSATIVKLGGVVSKAMAHDVAEDELSVLAKV